MNSDWEPIGEKVFSLNKNMEYRTDESDDYSVEQFEADLEIVSKNYLIKNSIKYLLYLSMQFYSLFFEFLFSYFQL